MKNELIFTMPINHYNISMMRLSEPESICQLLQTTFIGSTQQIKQAEQQLKQLHQDSAFLHNLMQVAKQTSNPCTSSDYKDNIRKSAVLYTLTYCRSIEASLKQQMISNLTTFLFSQLAEHNLEYNLRRHLINSILFVLSFDRNSRVKSIFYRQCLRISNEALQKCEDKGFIIFVGLAIQTVLTVSIHTSKELTEFVRASILNFTQISLNLITKLKVLIENQQSQSLLAQMLQIIKIYSFGFKLYMKKISYSDLQTVKFLYQPQICNLLAEQWKFCFKENLIATNLIYYSRFKDRQLEDDFHSIKADYIQSLGITMKTVFQYFRDFSNISSHPILGKPELISLLISAISNLCIVCPHHHITSYSLIKLIQEIMNCLIIAVKSKFYYQVFKSKKKQLIQDTLFSILEFSHQDYFKFCSDPEEITNEIVQIIQMDPTQFLISRKKQSEIVQEVEEIQNYKTVKTVASTLLFHYCRNVDGTLPEIITFCEKQLSSQKKSKFSKPLVLLILSILRDLICERRQQGVNLITFLTNRLKITPFPRPVPESSTTSVDGQCEQNFSYLLTLLCLKKYLFSVKNLSEEIISTLCQIIRSLMANRNVEQGLKLTAYEMITTFVVRDTEVNQAFLFLELANKILVSASESSGKILDMIYNIFKYKDNEIQSLAEQTLNIVGQMILKEGRKRDVADKDIINKCWNIIADICQNEKFAKKFCPQISNVLLALTAILKEYPGLQYDDHLLLCLSALIEITQQVTVCQLETFDFVPIFFESIYNLQFGDCFEAINLIVSYCSIQTIKQNPQVLHCFLQMSIKSMNSKQCKGEVRNWFQCCQGVLILQNLIIAYNSLLTTEIWQGIANQLLKRLNEVQQNPLKQNITATISLVLMYGISHFNKEQCNILLQQLQLNRNNLRDKHSNKIVIIALCHIIEKIEFSINTFQLLLDVVKLSRDIEDREEKKKVDELTKQYEKSVQMIKNKIVDMNDNSLFKQLINRLRIIGMEKFDSIVKQLPEQKITFLKSYLSTAKINNDTRQIFKIKR